MNKEKQSELYHHIDAEEIIRAILRHAKKTDPDGLQALIEFENSKGPPEAAIDIDQIKVGELK